MIWPSRFCPNTTLFRSHSMNSQLGDSLSGIRVVKAFAKEGVEGARFEAANARATASDCSVRQ